MWRPMHRYEYILNKLLATTMERYESYFVRDIQHEEFSQSDVEGVRVSGDHSIGGDQDKKRRDTKSHMSTPRQEWK